MVATLPAATRNMYVDGKHSSICGKRRDLTQDTGAKARTH